MATDLPPDLPARIRRFAIAMNRFGMGFTLEPVPNEPGQWVMNLTELMDGMQVPEGCALAIVYKLRGAKKTATDINLVIDGEPVKVPDMTSALMKMMGRAGKADGMSAVTSAAGSARSNSVETRRASVIRV